MCLASKSQDISEKNKVSSSEKNCENAKDEIELNQNNESLIFMPKLSLPETLKFCDILGSKMEMEFTIDLENFQIPEIGLVGKLNF